MRCRRDSLFARNALAEISFLYSFGDEQLACCDCQNSRRSNGYRDYREKQSHREPNATGIAGISSNAPTYY
jgi:hypothetical protein